MDRNAGKGAEKRKNAKKFGRERAGPGEDRAEPDTRGEWEKTGENGRKV